MKKFILVLLVLFSTSTCFAAFGGSRSGGSFSGGSRSFSSGGSFGGSRSSGAVRSYSGGSTFGGSRSSQSGPATITRPSVPTYSAPVIQRETTVIHHDSGGGFWSGMLMGNILGHSQQSVIVTPGVGGVMEGGVVQPVMVQQGHSIFFYLFWMMIFGVVVLFIVRMMKEE